jgi:putative addiction module component (TIGR02574 family)
MAPKAQQVLQQALRLPPKARADIASTLLHSLDRHEDADVDEALAAELERRVKDVESGRAKLIPWARARRSLWAGLKRGRTKA